MKILLILLTILSFSNAFAKEWKVVKVADTFQLVTSEKGERYTFYVASEGGAPKFVKEKKLNDEYDQVIYYAGTAGSSQPVEIYRSLVIKKSTMKLLKDLPYEYRPSKGTTYKPEQPIWNIVGKKLTVTDKENSESFSISLK